MKSLTLIISVVYFLTGIPVAFCGEDRIDPHVKLAELIKNQGLFYQLKAEREGYEQVKAELIEKMNRNIEKLCATSKSQIGLISEAQASELIYKLQEIPVNLSETLTMILNNRSFSSIEKVKKIHTLVLEDKFSGFKNEILEKIDRQGVEKTFNDIADGVRDYHGGSRYYFGKNDAMALAGAGAAILLVAQTALMGIIAYSLISGEELISGFSLLDASLSLVGVFIILSLVAYSTGALK